MSEFRRPFAVDRLVTGAGASVVVDDHIDATEKERAALATRFDLPSIAALSATVRIARRRDGTVHVRGSWAARYTQICVVTTEPFVLDRTEPLETVFEPVDPDLAPFGLGEAVIDVDDVDTEPLADGVIDLGELVAQAFGVQVDAHPRGPGADAAATPWSAADGEDGAHHSPGTPTVPQPPAYGDEAGPIPDAGQRPFAALASLLRKD